MASLAADHAVGTASHLVVFQHGLHGSERDWATMAEEFERQFAAAQRTEYILHLAQYSQHFGGTYDRCIHPLRLFLACDRSSLGGP